MDWKKDLDKEILNYINELIRKSELYSVYKKSSNPANAQLWVALGLMAKKIYEQELKIKVIEGVLMEISPRKTEKLKSQEERKKATQEIERIMKEIAQRKPVTLPIVPKPKTSIIFTKTKRKPSKRKKEINALKRSIKKNF